MFVSQDGTCNLMFDPNPGIPPGFSIWRPGGKVKIGRVSSFAQFLSLSTVKKLSLEGTLEQARI